MYSLFQLILSHIYFIVWSVGTYTVSQKNIPDVFSYITRESIVGFS